LWDEIFLSGTSSSRHEKGKKQLEESCLKCDYEKFLGGGDKMGSRDRFWKKARELALTDASPILRMILGRPLFSQHATSVVSPARENSNRHLMVKDRLFDFETTIILGVDRKVVMYYLGDSEIAVCMQRPMELSSLWIDFARIGRQQS
jgi:hypothetical protein